MICFRHLLELIGRGIERDGACARAWENMRQGIECGHHSRKVASCRISVRDATSSCVILLGKQRGNRQRGGMYSSCNKQVGRTWIWNWIQMVRIGSTSHFFEDGNEPWPYKIREFCAAVEKMSASQPSFCLVYWLLRFFIRWLFGYFISWAGVWLECWLVK